MSERVEQVRTVLMSRGIATKSVTDGPGRSVDIVFANGWSWAFDDDDFVRWNDEQLGNVAEEMLAFTRGGCRKCGES